ncbi:MAG: LysM peptidoglycan-binding domain-containing protein [Chlamydiae bacterium]|nr:LysM peptidoglycan-binding domain-containing protein [Chlamydiota bacterium]
MSRRDTIIIAVLVNAGILLVLFALAMPSKEQPAKIVKAVLEKSRSTVQDDNTHFVETVGLEEGAMPMDEIDQVLSEWNEQSRTAHKNVEGTAQTSEIVYSLKLESTQDEVEAAKSDKTVEVVVKKGDVLDKIARANGTTVQEIMKLNHISSTKLQIGQVLLVPEAGKFKVKAKAKTAKTQVESKSDLKGDSYTINSGDNPWAIANKNHIKLEELLRLNGLNEESAKRLKPGDKIRIK